MGLWVKSSRQVVLTALAQDGNAFQFADLNLRGDRKFVLQIVSNGQDEIGFVDQLKRCLEVKRRLECLELE